ncbi:MAG: UDP-N-acetylmuramate dehydrogenase [Acidimicrobiales bacterium]
MDAHQVELQEQLSAVFTGLSRELGSRVRQNYNIGRLTTYRIGGEAAVYVVAQSLTDLEALSRVLRAIAYSGPILVLGKGSNLLVADGGFSGVAISLGESFDYLELDGDSPHEPLSRCEGVSIGTEVTVRAGGMFALPIMARKCVSAGLLGAEWCVGVPGSVGGAVRMNAGGHGSSMSSMLVGCTVFNLRSGMSEWRKVDDLHTSYRSSDIAMDDLVMSADIALVAGDSRIGQMEIAKIVRWRRENQPGGSNAGSVFVNPPEAPAGMLVEEAGLKGVRMGTAQVSEKHGNFIQADDDGSADDVYALIRHVIDVVRDRCGVELRTELRLAGFPD